MPFPVFRRRGRQAACGLREGTIAETKFIGLIAQDQKFAIQLAPGHHGFMVVNEKAVLTLNAEDGV